VAIGNRTKVKVVKNKVSPPFTEGEFDILYAEGISWTGSIMDAAIAAGIVEKRGSWLSCDGEQLGQGRDAAAADLKKNPDLQAKLIEKVKAKHVGTGPKPAVTAAE
jgi:recombination protein RecA